MIKPNELRDRYRHDRPIDRAIIMQAADEIERLRAVLELIADHGGTYCADEETAITCNGSWCAEQARRALEETK
jgi:hypothetical protein